MASVGWATIYGRFLVYPETFYFGQHTDNHIFVTLHYQQITRFAQGILSLWDPHTYHSIAAINVGTLFYPPYLLIDYLLSLAISKGFNFTFEDCTIVYVLMTWIQNILAIIFFYMMCRALRFNIFGALIGAIVYGFSSYNILDSTVLFRLPLNFLFPLYIWLMLKYTERKNLRDLLLALFVASSLFLSQNVQPLFVLAPFVGGSLIVRNIRYKRYIPIRIYLRQMVWMYVPMLLGIMVVAPQFYQFMEVREFVMRSLIAPDSITWSLPPIQFLSHAVMPATMLDIDNSVGQGCCIHITEAAFWMGTSAWVCLVLLFQLRGKGRDLWILFGLFIFSVALTMAGYLGPLGEFYYSLTRGIVRFPIRNIEGMVFYWALLVVYLVGKAAHPDTQLRFSGYFYFGMVGVLLLGLLSATLLLTNVGSGVLLETFNRHVGEMGIREFIGRAILVALIYWAIVRIRGNPNGGIGILVLGFVAVVELTSFNTKILPLWRYGPVSYFTDSYISRYLDQRDASEANNYYSYDQVGAITITGDGFTYPWKGHPYSIVDKIDTMFSYLGTASNKALTKFYREFVRDAGMGAETLGSEIWDVLNVKYMTIVWQPSRVKSIVDTHHKLQGVLNKKEIIEYRPLPAFAYYPELIVSGEFTEITINVDHPLNSRVSSVRSMTDKKYFEGYVNRYGDLLNAYNANSGGQSKNDWGRTHYCKFGIKEDRSYSGLSPAMCGAGFNISDFAQNDFPGQISLRTMCGAEDERQFRFFEDADANITLKCKGEIYLAFSDGVNIQSIQTKADGIETEHTVSLKELGFRVVYSRSPHYEQFLSKDGSTWVKNGVDRNRIESFRSMYPSVGRSGYLAQNPRKYGQISPLGTYDNVVIVERHGTNPRIFQAKNYYFYEEDELRNIFLKSFYNRYRLTNSVLIAAEYENEYRELVNSKDTECSLNQFRQTRDGQSYVVDFTDQLPQECKFVLASPYTAEWTVHSENNVKGKIIPVLGGVQSLIVANTDGNNALTVEIDVDRYRGTLRLMLLFTAFGVLVLIGGARWEKKKYAAFGQ